MLLFQKLVKLFVRFFYVVRVDGPKKVYNVTALGTLNFSGSAYFQFNYSFEAVVGEVFLYHFEFGQTAHEGEDLGCPHVRNQVDQLLLQLGTCLNADKVFSVVSPEERANVRKVNAPVDLDVSLQINKVSALKYGLQLILQVLYSLFRDFLPLLDSKQLVLDLLEVSHHYSNVALKPHFFQKEVKRFLPHVDVQVETG